jgi:hypothetical protein
MESFRKFIEKEQTSRCREFDGYEVELLRKAWEECLKEKKEPVAEVPLQHMVSRIVSNMEKEANDLFARDVRDPRRGKAYYYNLRGNILKDFANVINKAMEG